LAGNHAEGALCAQQAAAALAAAGKPAEAAKWLVRAVRQLRTARMYDECLALMAEHPEVADSLGATEVCHTFGHLNAAGVMQCEAEDELLNTTENSALFLHYLPADSITCSCIQVKDQGCWSILPLFFVAITNHHSRTGGHNGGHCGLFPQRHRSLPLDAALKM